MTTITFVRHGNTYWNVEKRAQGHSNNPLNEIGFKQAQAVAARLAKNGDQWDMLIASDLKRATQTAEIISREIDQPIALFDKRLREIGRGQIQGMVEADRIEKWGPDWRDLDLGIETRESVRKRGMDFVKDMSERYPEAHLLVVSHGILIKETVKGLLEEKDIDGTLENTSLCTVEKHPSKWMCTLYNCAKHLEGATL
ncbi:MAG TPA: histidine phosphatase family protein [Virgibacillus sp.]|nr:histidine phosphatase family protein [Virgibacillus sp.]